MTNTIVDQLFMLATLVALMIAGAVQVFTICVRAWWRLTGQHEKDRAGRFPSAKE